MKNTFSKIVLILLAVVMINTSCDDGFAELNVDPTVANDIDPRFQFTWVQLRTSGERYENWRASLIYSSTMIQHLATDCGYWSGDKYSFNPGYSASLWERGYPQQVKEIEDLVATLESGAQGTPEMLGVAKIWRTLIYHRMTDMYGDIPYSQAGRGFLEGIDNPVYDSQESIYAGMLADLEEGVALISGDGGYGGADLFYGGNSDQWRRFGNSMMLRLGMRMSEVDPSGAQAWVQKAIAGGVMESVADDAFIQHTQGPGGINQNGLGEVLDLSNGSANENCPRISETFMNWMKDHSDPRMEIIAIPAVNTGEYTGMPNGLDAQLLAANPTGTDREDFSRVNQAMVEVSDPMVFMTYAEVEFLLAEAVMRGWTSGSAADHYNAGVKAAMQMLTKFDDSFAITDDQVDTYLMANPFVEAEGMRQIGEQYWIATLWNEYEAYANFRRTGYPELTPVDFPGNESNSQIPLRLRYPQAEYGVNGANIEAANARQGADQFTTPVWWDK